MRYPNGLPTTEPLQATQQHCHFCFDTLRSHLLGEAGPLPAFSNDSCPLFVTWNIKSSTSSSSSSWRLRGCIGTLEPKQLHAALRDYALTSALRDHRFSPVQLREVPSLKCSVSLLSCFEKAADWTDWTVGVHGIIIEFNDPEFGGRLTATFLPDVAPEQGWSQQECVDALVRKAGYAGRVGPQLRAALSLVRYQSTKASLTYDEYVAAREEAEEAEAATGAPARQPAMKVAA